MIELHEGGNGLEFVTHAGIDIRRELIPFAEIYKDLDSNSRHNDALLKGGLPIIDSVIEYEQPLRRLTCLGSDCGLTFW